MNLQAVIKQVWRCWRLPSLEFAVVLEGGSSVNVKICFETVSDQGGRCL